MELFYVVGLQIYEGKQNATKMLTEPIKLAN